MDILVIIVLFPIVSNLIGIFYPGYHLIALKEKTITDKVFYFITIISALFWFGWCIFYGYYSIVLTIWGVNTFIFPVLKKVFTDERGRVVNTMNRIFNIGVYCWFILLKTNNIDVFINVLNYYF